MIYSAHIETVLDTPLTSPKLTRLSVSKGLVYKIELYFPLGSAGLLGARIFDGSNQVWPSTEGQWFTGNGVLISFDELYYKSSSPYQFQIESYNLDDTYNHVFDLRLGLVAKEVYIARFVPSYQWEYFAKLLKGVEKEKAATEEKRRTSFLKKPFRLFGIK